MVSIKWCLAQKDGLRFIEPNKNISSSYLEMAEESINVLTNIKNSKIWIATTTYYIFYYSLYSFMLRMGIKCGIHSCSLEFMKILLNEFYSKKDLDMIEKAFKARIDLQYYTDRPIDGELIEEIRKYCKDFYIKTKDILANLNEEKIQTIRNNLRRHNV